MTEELTLHNYMQEYTKIREHAASLNYTDAQIDECFQCSIKHANKYKKTTKLTTTFKALIVSLTSLLIIYILLYVHQPTSSLVLRNVQSFIYPGFKVVRNLGIPIISLFPALTAFYDETCLVENPYFQVSNLDCYPCEHVHSVINLTGLSLNYSIHETGTPFVISDQREVIVYNDIAMMYHAHSNVFDENAPWMIKTNNASIKNISDAFHVGGGALDKQTFVHWRINRMLPARIVRKLFARPGFITEWSGQSIERYILLDGAESSGYSLPSFECSYVFLIQGSGERDIVLEATPECKNNCKRISVRMKPSYILWYNWWYWKPLSLPAENSTNVSVSYISSYC